MCCLLKNVITCGQFFLFAEGNTLKSCVLATCFFNCQYDYWQNFGHWESCFQVGLCPHLRYFLQEGHPKSLCCCVFYCAITQIARQTVEALLYSCNCCHSIITKDFCLKEISDRSVLSHGCTNHKQRHTLDV